MTAPSVNGCHNREPYKQSMIVQDGWLDQPINTSHTTRIPLMVASPFRMAMDCQYTKTELGQADKRCAGCKWRADAGAE